MGFEVREATVEDVEDIVQLWVELSKGQLSKDPFYKGSLEFASGYNQIKQSVMSDSCGIFVVINEERIEGFIEVWSDVERFQFEHDDCAYILHCIFRNQKKASCSVWHMASCVYYAAEDWAKAHGKKFLTADVFGHNKIVAQLLGRANLNTFKKRMVRKI